MGNVPSSVESPEGGGRKLSKPRTGNYAAAGLLSPNGSTTELRQRFQTSRAMSLSYASSPASSPRLPLSENQNAGQTVQRSASRPKFLGRSKSLFRSRSLARRSKKENTTNVALPERVQPERANTVQVGARDSLLRAQTSGLGVSAPGTRLSVVNYDPTSYDAQRLLDLSMAEEPPCGHDVALSEAELPAEAATWRHSNLYPGSDDGSVMGLAQADSEFPHYAPMRRRSLLVPGIATRPRSTTLNTNPRLSLPSSPVTRESIGSPESDMFYFRQLDINPASIPRAVTPNEDDYRPTGAFKRGSLRITNGSPVRSPAEVFDDTNTRSRTLQVPRVDAGRGWTPSSRAEPSINAGAWPDSSTMPSPAILNVDFGSVGWRGSGSTYTSQAADTHAQPDVLPEIPLSPLSIGSRLSELLTTSKLTAMEDHLFNDDEQEYQQPEILDVRIDPNAKSRPSKDGPHGKNSQSISRSDSGLVLSPSETPQKPLEKADSGYSSNTSLRSFSMRPSRREKKSHPAPDVEIAGDSINNRPQSEYKPSSSPMVSPRFSTGMAIERPQALSPVLSPVLVQDEPATPTRPRARSEVPQRSRSSMWPLRQGSFSAKFRSIPSPLKGSRFQDVEEASPTQSPGSPPSSGSSSMSIDSVSRRPGRLQRLLSGARSPLTTHVTHPPSPADVPPVPQAVKDSLNEHTGKFPMPSTRLALKPEPSKETLGTIFSVGSSEITAEKGREKDVEILPRISDEASREDEQQETCGTQEMQQLGISSVFMQSSAAQGPVPSRNPSNKREENPRSEFNLFEPVPVALPPRADFNRLERGAINDRPAAENKLVASLAHSSSVGSRSSTMTAQAERDFEMRYTAFHKPLTRNPSNPKLPLATQPPPVVAHLKRSKSPPPVSLRTRPQPPIRGGPPSRAQSTPPQDTGARRGSLLSRQASREAFRTHPATTNSAPMSRQSSRENLNGLPSSSQHYHNGSGVYVAAPPAPHMPPMDPMTPRRSVSFMTPTGEHRRPVWEVNTEHDESRSKTPSIIDGHIDRSRRNSMTSQSSRPSSAMGAPRPVFPWQAPTNDGYADHSRHNSLSSHSSRPSSAMGNPRPVFPWQAPTYDGYADLSRHNSLSSHSSRSPSAGGRPRPYPQWHASSCDAPPRPFSGWQASSYDAPMGRPNTSFGEQSFSGSDGLDDSIPCALNDNGPYPSMVGRDGRSYVSDPMSGRLTQHWDRRGRYPIVPRGHYRNRSTDVDGNPSPYRVLHSYYSPAYRNAPIWG